MWNKYSLIFVAVTCFSIQLAYAKTAVQGDTSPPPSSTSPPPRSTPPSTEKLPPPPSKAPPPGDKSDPTNPDDKSRPPPSTKTPLPGDKTDPNKPDGKSSPPPPSTNTPLPNKPDSDALTMETLGCEQLDACVKTLNDELNGKFAYTKKVCLAIHTALTCYDAAITACTDYKNPFEGKTESFITLRDHLANYCSETDATLSSCAGFETCFKEVKLPQTAKDFVDPMYWCAVGQAAVACDTKETSVTSECTPATNITVIQTELNKTCPSPVDVLKTLFGSTDNGVDAGRYNIMVILVTSLVAIKMVY